MQESAIARQCRKDGTLIGTRAAVVKALQTRFPETPVSKAIRAALEKNKDERQLSDWLGAAILTASLADFERFLMSPNN